MYEPVKSLFVGKDFKGDPSMPIKIAAGLTTGAAAICIASPTDLVKVRLCCGCACVHQTHHVMQHGAKPGMPCLSNHRCFSPA